MLSRREDNAQRVAALEAAATGLKLKPGMGIAEARALHPAIEVVEADPDADRRLLEGLADWCDRYTPLVAIDGADGLFLDITGCAHLFGGERALLDDLMARFFHQGFEVRASLASTPGTAWAMARFGHAPAVVEAGREAQAVAPLPLGALRLEAAPRAGLEGVGLRTVGAVMGMPRAPLVRRFGRGVVLRLDQALGAVEEPISPRRPVPPLSVERMLAEPIALMEDIEGLVGLLAGQMKRDLERRGEGAERLRLSLFRVDGAVSRLTVGASRPLRDPERVRNLFRERFAGLEETLDAGYGFDLVRLSVLSAVPMAEAQADLHGGEDDNDDDGEVALFADRVRARLGDGAIRRPLIVASHVPERAAPLSPLSLGAERVDMPGVVVAAGSGPRGERPLRLLAVPECVEVSAAEVPEGPPLKFRWRRVGYRVARAEGPERIAPEWWQAEENGATRDYFRVEDADGRRYWLFREGLYDARQASPRWYVQGLFA